MNQMIILSPGPGDMTDEIQDAIDRAHESCGAVFFAPGVYEIWYKVTGDPNYVELSDWNGPVTASRTTGLEL